MKNYKKLPIDPTPTSLPPPHSYPYYSYVSAWEGAVRRGGGGCTSCLGVREGGGGFTSCGGGTLVGGYIGGGGGGGTLETD